MVPSGVIFFSSIKRRDSRLVDGGLELGGKGEGSEEAEVRAGAIRKPRGSLRLVFDMRRTEPKDAAQVSYVERTPKHFTVSCVKLASRTNDMDVPPRACDHRSRTHVPGTSSVSLSFKTPKLHFSGLVLASSYPSEDTTELEGSGFRPPKNLRHVGILNPVAASGSAAGSCFSSTAGLVVSKVVPIETGNDCQWRGG